MANKNDNISSPIVSIIVPIYNVEQYLPACLDSLVNQTLRDIEIICVNDSSLDNSLKIAENYAAQDKRIKIISHECNQGLGPARNTGVEFATAPYIIFVDSDDIIAETMVEKLYLLMADNNADMGWCNIGSITEDGDIKKEGYSIPEGIYTPQKVLEKAQLYQTLLPVWNKMYKREMIVDVKQPPIVSEDQPFLSVVLGRCRRIAISSETYYFYRNRQGTLSKPKLHTAQSWDAFFYAHKLFFENLSASIVSPKGLRTQCVKRYFSMFWRIRTFRLTEQSTWKEQGESILTHLISGDIPIKQYCLLLYWYIYYVFGVPHKNSTNRWIHLGYDLSAYMSNETSVCKLLLYLCKRSIRVFSHYVGNIIDNLEQLFFCLLSKCISQRIWLIGERLDTYQDNGMYFFKYMQQHAPVIQSYYVIDKKQAHLVNDSQVLIYNSFKHKLFFYAAEVYANAHYDAAYPRTCCNRKRYSFPKHTINVFLQHGITYSNVNQYYGKNHSDINIFVCAVPIEKKVAMRDFGYGDEEAVLTGFARYDGLNNPQTKRQILLMPTWRRTLHNCTLKDFLISDYYQTLHTFLTSPDLHQWLRGLKMQLVFAPHYEMAPYIATFQDVENDCIHVINSAKQSVQQLLKESMLLITDVSSVQFDFAYMQKPLLYYQWDYDNVVAKHLSKGYFDFSKNGFGKICHNLDEVLRELVHIEKNNWQMEDFYCSRVKKFFYFRDENNCKRIYEAIVKRL